ncbi:uncharacterized protein LOC127739207 [Mytilus californianus]|uniref:uncharacterized protein LOC127739207 n=1 Tax=Mytilus californianus TaxID=6549 RepID=UPI002246207A|nr:uncharacterized protein LOC127739207 [Mytilus californianus]
MSTLLDNFTEKVTSHLKNTVFATSDTTPFTDQDQPDKCDGACVIIILVAVAAFSSIILLLACIFRTKPRDNRDFSDKDETSATNIPHSTQSSFNEKYNVAYVVSEKQKEVDIA